MLTKDNTLWGPIVYHHKVVHIALPIFWGSKMTPFDFSVHPHTTTHRWSFLWACELVFIQIFTSDIFSHYQAETNPQPLFHHSRVAPAKDCIMDLVGLEDDVLLLELFLEICLPSFHPVTQASPRVKHLCMIRFETVPCWWSRMVCKIPWLLQSFTSGCTDSQYSL